MQSGYVPVGETRIFYETSGEGPAVLFLHAGVADHRMWQAQMGLDGFRTIAFDQRGFGQTLWVPDDYSNRHDALAVLDHLEVDQAVIVGCSNGGEAAMQLSIIAPERTKGLVLVGAAARGWEPEGGWGEDPLEEDAITAFEAGDFDSAVGLEAQMWLAGPGRSLDSIDPGLVELFMEMDRIPLMTESERGPHIQTLEPPTNERLYEIEAPTLVVVGEYDYPDLITSARYLAEKLSHRDAVVLLDTAHLPSLEKPDTFNAAMAPFLASL